MAVLSRKGSHRPVLGGVTLLLAKRCGHRAWAVVLQRVILSEVVASNGVQEPVAGLSQTLAGEFA